MQMSRQSSPARIRTDQKQLENVEYFNNVGSILTNDAACTDEIKSSTAMAKVPLQK
jgi:hypothetical protein